MKLLLVLLALTLVIVVGCSKSPDEAITSPTIVTSPQFPDGSHLISTDGGKTWEQVPPPRKAVTCTCDCSYNGRGVYPGSCKVGAYDYSCQDWCTGGGAK